MANFDQAFANVSTNSTLTPAWLLPLRSRAFERFKKQGLPTRQVEEWKYTSTRPLQEDYAPAAPSASLGDHNIGSFFLGEGSAFVFVNGIFDKSLSVLDPEAGLTVEPIEKALPGMETAFTEEGADLGSIEALNKALFAGGAVVRVARNVELKKPLQLLFITVATDVKQLIAPRNLVLLEQGARAQIVESHFNYLESNFTNAVTEIRVADQASCKIVFEKVLSSDSLHVSSSMIRVGRDAEVESFVLSLGGKLNRTQLRFDLDAPGARVRLDGLYVGKQSSHIDNVTEVSHNAANTKSSQLYKGILSDESRAVFNGKITIVKQAQQVEALQLNKNLLMSDGAEVDTRPQLQIDADDVRCSHGATIGQLDEDELFYLQSRGIPRSEAEHMLAKAFVGDVIGRHGEFVQQRLSRILREFGGMDA